MLREEQIDIRRKRAAEEGLCIQNLGRNRVFSDYQVTNPKTEGKYRVSIRGFDIGDNTCECPDFRKNTLGTCKHIEAVLTALRDETPPQVTRSARPPSPTPRSYLQYGEQLRVRLHLPPRHSATMLARPRTRSSSTLKRPVERPATRYEGADRTASPQVPEQVTIFSDAMDFMEREIDRREMA